MGKSGGTSVLRGRPGRTHCTKWRPDEQGFYRTALVSLVLLLSIGLYCLICVIQTESFKKNTKLQEAVCVVLRLYLHFHQRYLVFAVLTGCLSVFACLLYVVAEILTNNSFFAVCTRTRKFFKLTITF